MDANTEKIKCAPGQNGDFAVTVGLIVVDSRDTREFYTPDGVLVGRYRRQDASAEGSCHSVHRA